MTYSPSGVVSGALNSRSACPAGWGDVRDYADAVAVKGGEGGSGVDRGVGRVIGVFDGLRLGFARIPLYSLIFHCRAVGGSLKRLQLECADVGWFREDCLPEPIAGAAHWGEHAFAAIRGEPVDVLYDLPRRPPWRRATDDGIEDQEFESSESED